MGHTLIEVTCCRDCPFCLSPEGDRQNICNLLDFFDNEKSECDMSTNTRPDWCPMDGEFRVAPKERS